MTDKRGEMEVFYAMEPLPFAYMASPTIFLAGPTPRAGAAHRSWRPRALDILEKIGFQGKVAVPESPDFNDDWDWHAQVDWEWAWLDAASCVVFWVPRNMVHFPGLTTNVEFGLYVPRGKCVCGAPPEAEHVNYLKRIAARYDTPWFDDLEVVLRTAKETA